MNTSVKRSKVFNLLRWTARILGTLLLLLIIVIGIGEGLPNPMKLSVQENILLAAIVIMSLGLALAWKWEGLGGILILGGLGLFTAINRGIQMNIVFGSLLIIGVLFLSFWLANSKWARR